MIFFNIERDDKYCKEVFCNVYVSGRWFEKNSSMTILDMLSLNFKGRKNPVYNPKLLIDILLVHPAWEEGWEIIKDDFIDWVKNSELSEDIKKLDLNILTDRKRFISKMNSMMLFSCSVMRKKIIDIIKSKGANIE